MLISDKQIKNVSDLTKYDHMSTRVLHLNSELMSAIFGEQGEGEWNVQWWEALNVFCTGHPGTYSLREIHSVLYRGLGERFSDEKPWMCSVQDIQTCTVSEKFTLYSTEDSVKRPVMRSPERVLYRTSRHVQSQRNSLCTLQRTRWNVQWWEALNVFCTGHPDMYSLRDIHSVLYRGLSETSSDEKPWTCSVQDIQTCTVSEKFTLYSTEDSVKRPVMRSPERVLYRTSRHVQSQRYSLCTLQRTQWNVQRWEALNVFCTGHPDMYSLREIHSVLYRGLGETSSDEKPWTCSVQDIQTCTVSEIFTLYSTEDSVKRPAMRSPERVLYRTSRHVQSQRNSLCTLQRPQGLEKFRQFNFNLSLLATLLVHNHNNSSSSGKVHLLLSLASKSSHRLV